METTKKTKRSLQVFISFGSAERDLCRHIKDILEAWGHTPWFDEEHILMGNDLRARITESMNTVDAAVFCMSQDSLHSRWCPEEIRILRDYLGEDNIHVLILEELDMGELPTVFKFLASRKGQDLTQWKRYFQPDTDEEVGVFWLRRRLEEQDKLFDALERSDGPEVAAQRNIIRRKLSVNPDTVKRDDLLQRGIIGREWLAERVRNWLRDPDASPLCVLYGGPGVGKSAFVARCLDKGPKPAAALFCEYDRPYESEPKAIVRTLAYLLTRTLPDYRVRLLSILDSDERIAELDAAGQLARLIERPLRDIPDADREMQYMIIDGLDECDTERRNEFTRMLAGFARRLPRWMRLLVTSREIEEVTGPFAAACRLDLNGEQRENLNDIRAYYKSRLEARFGQEASWKRALDELVKRSGGVFLYAQIVSDGVLAGKLSLDEPEKFPADLSASFDRWFYWFFPDVQRYQSNYRLPIGMIVASEEPLPVEELGRVCGWDENETEDFLRFLKPFLKLGTNLFQKETVTLTHKYLSEWLGSRRAGSYSCNPKAARRKMAERFNKLFRQDVERLTEYEALHLLDLLEEFCSHDDWRTAIMDEHLSSELTDLGDICQTWGDLSLALAYYQQAKKIDQYMVNRRGNLFDWEYLAVDYGKIASVFDNAGQPGEALKFLPAYFEILNRCMNEFNKPERGIYQNLRDYYTVIARVYTQTGQSAEALQFCQNALELARQLTQDNGKADDWRSLGLVYYCLAELAESGGNYSDALGFYQEALKAVGKVKREGAKTLARKTALTALLGDKWGDWRDKLVCRHKIADMLLENGLLKTGLLETENAEEVFPKYQETREEFLHLSEAWPTPLVQRDVCVSDNNLAYLLERDDPDAALELYRHDATLSEELARRFDTPFNRADLALAYWNLANLWREARERGLPLSGMERAEALAYAEKGMELARTLYESMRHEADADAEQSDAIQDAQTVTDGAETADAQSAVQDAQAVTDAVQNTDAQSDGVQDAQSVTDTVQDADAETKDWEDYQELYQDYQELCRWISGAET